MAGMKVVLLEERFGDHTPERSVLESIGAEVIEVHQLLGEDEIINICRDADGVTVNLAAVTARVIANLEKCRVIGRYGVGYDNVDIAAAKARGIKVVNVPDYCKEDVSDHAMALLLACVRKVVRRDRQVRNGLWNVGRADPIHRIKGRTMGIVGLGRIGSTFCRKLTGFELGRILVYDPYIPREVITGAGAEPSDFDTLLRESDYISVHTPLTAETKGMFSTPQFRTMKKSAILINTARGPVVDGKALYEALKSGELNSAGLDVHEIEPIPEGSPWFELENVTLTDHAGWYSEESQIELQTKCAENVAAVLRGEDSPFVVNP